MAAIISLLRPSAYPGTHEFHRTRGYDLGPNGGAERVLPELAVEEGIFDTFDPEGVADMIYGLAARTNSKILDVLQADDESARDHAVDVLTTRFTLHGLAIDRILRLPDGSITTLTRADVVAMVAALRRNY
jgi:hypothetical protein